MKKLLSLLMVMCMLFTVVIPASATETEPTVTIGGIAEGDIYSVGSNIIITAQTNMADVKNIDIYANGDKLPGTIIGAEGTYVWYAPSSGSYAVKAVVSTSENANALESSVVNIKINPSKAPSAVLSNFNSEDDLANWTWYGTNTYSAADLTTDYNRFGNYTLHAKVLDSSTQYRLDANLNNIEKSVNKNLRVVVPIYFSDDRVTTGKLDTYAYVAALHRASTAYGTYQYYAEPGWNITSLAPLGSDTLTNVKFHWRERSGFVTSGKSYYLDVYYGPVWCVNDNDGISDTLDIEKTSFKDGATGVCYNPGNYRITFNEEIIANSQGATLTKLAADGETYEAVEGYTVEIGNDYLDIIIPDGTLATDSTYKVTVGTNVWDIVGMEFKGAEYTFSTVDDQCTNLTPIIDIVYPADGANVGTSTTVAAKVTFSSAVEGVTFTAGDGTPVSATAYNNGEYAINLDGLTAGTPVTIIATATDNAEITDSITVTPSATQTYAVWGLADNDYILASFDGHRTVSLIDGTASKLPGTTLKTSSLPYSLNFDVTYPTDLAYVDFILDGELAHRATSAPYSYDIPLNMLGSHTMKINAVSNIGTFTSFTKSFKMLSGNVISKYENDYTDGVVPSWNNAEGSDEDVAVETTTQADNTSGNALHIKFKAVDTASIKDADIFNLENLGDGKGIVVHAEFDVIFKTQTQWNRICIGTNTNFLFQTMNKSNYSANLWPTDKWKHVKIDYYPEKGTSITYVDGVEYARAGIDNQVVDGNLRFMYRNASSIKSALDACYIDNLKAYAYEVKDSGLHIDVGETTIKAYNHGDDDESFVVIKAAYTGEGTSKNLDTVKIEYSPVIKAKGVFEMPYEAVSAGSSMFIWRSLTDMMPLTDALVK